MFYQPNREISSKLVKHYHKTKRLIKKESTFTSLVCPSFHQKIELTSRNWMLSLRYEDHLYAKLFHHLISLHCHDQVICWVWWKHGLEIRIKSITTRGSGISKIHKPKECGNGDGGSEGLFVLIQRQEWRNEAKEREPKPPSNIHKGGF